MGGCGDEADGVEHGTAADRDDEGVPVDMMIEQHTLHLLDVEQLVLDRLAAGHRQRWCDQLQTPVVMRGIGGDLGGQRWPPSEQAVIDEHQAAMSTLRLESPHHLGQDRVVRVKKPIGEMNRVLEQDGDLLQVGHIRVFGRLRRPEIVECHRSPPPFVRWAARPAKAGTQAPRKHMVCAPTKQSVQPCWRSQGWLAWQCHPGRLLTGWVSLAARGQVR